MNIDNLAEEYSCKHEKDLLKSSHKLLRKLSRNPIQRNEKYKPRKTSLKREFYSFED